MTAEGTVDMQAPQQKVEAGGSASPPTSTTAPDIAAASVPDTLVALGTDAERGLTQAEVDGRRKKHGYNEVTERKEHPVLRFLGKFWGLSAWMLELIVVLSAVLRKYSDRAVVDALLGVEERNNCDFERISCDPERIICERRCVESI